MFAIIFENGEILLDKIGELFYDEENRTRVRAEES